MNARAARVTSFPTTTRSRPDGGIAKLPSKQFPQSICNKMSANNRAVLIGKLHSALKKHYKVAPAQPTRPLLEHVLYGSLLQDAPAELADEGMAKCEQEFFDWNEVRVTTVTELSQVLSRLPDPVKAAQRVKSNLQSIFEEFYTFDLDHLKKENLGKATTKFERMPGMTPFVLSYTVQHGLGGHSIPVDYSAMVIMLATGVASQVEANSGKVPGLERAIPKSKGIEFAGLLHQAGIALNNNPKDKKGRAVLDSVVKGASDQLDEWLASKKAAKKRAVKRKAAEKAAAEEAATEALEAAKIAKSVKKKKAAKTQPEKRPLPAKPGEKKAAAPAAQSASKSSPSKTASKSSASKSSAASKPASAKKSAPVKQTPAVKKRSAKKKPPAKKTPAAAKKTAGKKTTPAKATAKSKKSVNRKLSKRKPR